MDLSVIIAARNEMFLCRTVEDVLHNMKGDTEIIVICDGNWPDPPVPDNPRVILIYHPVSIGQRAAVNEGIKYSRAKFVMKLDAHCSVDDSFDKKLMEDCQYDWTVIPRMYNLHAFDWKCKKCDHQVYQGPYPTKCEKCDNTKDFERVLIWQPRWNRGTDFARFDNTLHFQYWGSYKKRPEASGDIADVMCQVGACWFMHRERFWDLDGVDEAHGSWGQMGVEISCKSWLSGGRQVVNKKTWFSHLFRTQPGFGFPYPNPGIEKARAYSRKLWFDNTWPKAKYQLPWLINKFAPVPDWEVIMPSTPKSLTKGFVYYTDNRLDEVIMTSVQKQIKKCANGGEIVSASLKPIEFGKNVVLPLERGYLTMFKQILAGLEASTADIIFLVEHDVLYHPSHFNFIPAKKDLFYYNENRWFVDVKSGRALFYHAMSTSLLCAYRELLIEHYRKRVERVEKEGFTLRLGFEPGNHKFPRGVDYYGREAYFSEFPCIDIRHSNNLTWSRWRKDQFRNQKNLYAWKEADEVPGWGIVKGRFQEILQEINNAL